VDRNVHDKPLHATHQRVAEQKKPNCNCELYKRYNSCNTVNSCVQFLQHIEQLHKLPSDETTTRKQKDFHSSAAIKRLLYPQQFAITAQFLGRLLLWATSQQRQPNLKALCEKLYS